ncbi:hypothetical protein [Stutzerimonas kirkiae]|uniref:Cobalamin ABC transporter n=1 Tax=Stutzerimonas kirkiae TaxID=2211392 RepID=A0A4Q9R9G6_9GAMM|nr:hypothetical protein [Stutzerimonas kirkiae]TBU97336.1 hypothetical protein DNJ96_08535 [Stutzerimonas kirkiae]TBV02968.1 hypothetical protein DNJ95_08395 [Stutzerimonas kirkiae]TBV06635.1 hypothetical protein DNK08_14280 [Stutzerimonas kirkiae]TBV13069.1 hypothetical protein DNK01_13060 [Stutzerimonas kirkiae]
MHHLSARSQVLIGLGLAVLMAMTRGQHFASVDNLPSASWAVFFLAGVYLRPRWAFALFFAEATLLDFGSLASGTISDWCLSPVYWMLLLAYGCLWFAGRAFATHVQPSWRSPALLALSLAGTLVVAALVAHLISSGGFYFFSGRYAEPSLAGFIERMGIYYPRYLSNLALYVTLVAIIHIGMAAFVRMQQRATTLS